MTLPDLLVQLNGTGISLGLSTKLGTLRAEGPTGAVTPAIQAQLLAHKTELLVLLGGSTTKPCGEPTVCVPRLKSTTALVMPGAGHPIPARHNARGGTAPACGIVTISGQPFTISYVGGTGNDVVLTAVDPNTTTTSTTTTSTTTTTTIAGGTTTTTTAGGTTTTTTAGGVTTTTTAGGATTTLTPTTTIAPAGGGLPPTGSNSSDGVQLAVLALLAGVVLIVVARRRLNTKGD